jgi:hypothetical protein
LRACAPPSISESVDVWRIDSLLTQKLYRNGCIPRGSGKIRFSNGKTPVITRLMVNSTKNSYQTNS